MIWLLALFAAGAAVVATSSTSKTEPLPRKEDEFTSTGDPIADIMAIAKRFETSIDAAAASPKDPNWAALAQVANDKKAAEEAAARKYINETFDKYRNAAVVGATATGYGVIAVPIIIMAAELGKWAANAQITLFKALGVAANGWSETWQGNVQGEINWLVERGIPFPAWDQKAFTSPMGYVNSGGGTTCGHGGLCAIREAYGKYLRPLEMANAMRAWKVMKRHITDNPLVLAFYTRVGMPDGAFIITNGFDAEGNEGASAGFAKLFCAALASSVCQEEGVPFALWKSVIEGTQKEFERLFKSWQKSGAHFPFSESVGSTYNQAVWLAQDAIARSGGVLTLKLPSFKK